MWARTARIPDVETGPAGGGSNASHQFLAIWRVRSHLSKVIDEQREGTDMAVVVVQRNRAGALE